MRVFIALMALGGCTMAGAGHPDELARELAGRVAGEPRSCIPTNPGASLTRVDDRHVAYRRRGVIWVSRMRDGCPGLRPFDILIVETHAAGYCRGDKVRALESGTGIPGPLCVLGDFIPYRAG